MANFESFLNVAISGHMHDCLVKLLLNHFIVGKALLANSQFSSYIAAALASS
jgi:hypothetical protein